MMNSLQPSTNLDSGQGNALNSLQQVPVGSIQQTPASAPWQANMNGLSSQSGLSMPQPNVNSLHSNSGMLQHQQLKQHEQQMFQNQPKQTVSTVNAAAIDTEVADTATATTATVAASKAAASGGSAPGNGCRAAVGEDLVAMTKFRLQARNVMTHDGSNGTRKMRRYTSAMPLNVVSSAGSMNDSFKRLINSETSDLELTATSRSKRPRVEVLTILCYKGGELGM